MRETPKELLAKVIEQSGYKTWKIAELTGLTANQITSLVKKTNSQKITKPISEKLHLAFPNYPRYHWSGLQDRYDRFLIRQKEKEQ